MQTRGEAGLVVSLRQRAVYEAGTLHIHACAVMQSLVLTTSQHLGSPVSYLASRSIDAKRCSLSFCFLQSLVLTVFQCLGSPVNIAVSYLASYLIDAKRCNLFLSAVSGVLTSGRHDESLSVQD